MKRLLTVILSLALLLGLFSCGKAEKKLPEDFVGEELLFSQTEYLLGSPKVGQFYRLSGNHALEISENRKDWLSLGTVEDFTPNGRNFDEYFGSEFHAALPGRAEELRSSLVRCRRLLTDDYYFFIVQEESGLVHLIEGRLDEQNFDENTHAELLCSLEPLPETKPYSVGLRQTMPLAVSMRPDTLPVTFSINERYLEVCDLRGELIYRGYASEEKTLTGKEFIEQLQNSAVGFEVGFDWLALREKENLRIVHFPSNGKSRYTVLFADGKPALFSQGDDLLMSFSIEGDGAAELTYDVTGEDFTILTRGEPYWEKGPSKDISAIVLTGHAIKLPDGVFSIVVTPVFLLSDRYCLYANMIPNVGTLGAEAAEFCPLSDAPEIEELIKEHFPLSEDAELLLSLPFQGMYFFRDGEECYCAHTVGENDLFYSSSFLLPEEEPVQLLGIYRFEPADRNQFRIYRESGQYFIEQEVPAVRTVD